ncbi:MAG: prephenate dehydratase [Chloroflexota bacterium]
MASDPATQLSELRARIDALDDQIVALLNDRARISLEVGQVKGAEAPVFVPAREAELLERLATINTGPLSPSDLAAIYREMLAASRRLQRPMRIAYFGPAATFTHQAALQRFGSVNELIPLATIADVFAEVERRGAEFGVVPIENTTEGSVYETLDLLAAKDLRVCAEITLHIAQNLLARCSLDEITTVYSHRQAIAQTRNWLAAHLPGREIRESASTATAAELAAREPNVAAVAPRLAADVYGLDVLAEGIQDISSNFTRFFVIGPATSDRPTGRDKTLLLLSIRDRVGALRDIVNEFANASINLSAIQSRPSRRRAWDYLFFVELQGHIEEDRVREAVKRIEQHCVSLTVLGAWPDERLG